MEQWDAYDETFCRVPGKILIRGEPIPGGLYHLVCDVLVRHTDGDYLLMQRDPRKHFGGLWEATAGGSALRNETPHDCARRELYEETGICSTHLAVLGQVKRPGTIYVEFLCITDCEKDSVRLQAGETVAFRWVSRDALVAMRPQELVTTRMQTFLPELQP